MIHTPFQIYKILSIFQDQIDYKEERIVRHGQRHKIWKKSI